MLNFRSIIRKMFGLSPRATRPRSRSSGHFRPQAAWVSGLERLEDRVCLSAVGFFALADGFTAVDQGYDSTTQMTYIVGQQDTETGSDASLLRSIDLRDYQTDVLIGLGPDTQVGGISSDGVRIAGVSKSPGSVDVGEGTTWLSSDPSSPTGIGFVGGFEITSVASGAWSSGIVGDHGGAADAVFWTADTGLVILPDDGGQSTTFDVSANGLVQVGFIQAKPVYWDSNGSNYLENPENNAGRALTVSPNAVYAGGGIDFLDFQPVFDAGTQAVVWDFDGTDYQANLLTWADGSRVKGEVVDVTDSGYAVIALSEGGAAIYNSDMGVMTMADFVALHGDGVELPDPTDVPVAIIDVADGVVQIACQTVIIKVDMNEDGITTIEGTDGNDNISERVAAGESLRILAGDGNDRITVFLDGPGASLIVDGGDGNDRISVYTRGANADVYVSAGDGNDTVSSYITNAPNSKFFAELGDGDDRFSNYVFSSDGTTQFVDVGDGKDRSTSRLFYSEDVSVGIVGSEGDTRISNLAFASPGFTQATVLGDGDHRVSNRAFYSDGGLNVTLVGAGRSYVSDFAYRSDDVTGVYVIGDGRSRFTGLAIASDNVMHEVYKSDPRTRARGFGFAGSTDYLFSIKDDRDDLFVDPLIVLDLIFAEFD